MHCHGVHLHQVAVTSAQRETSNCRLNRSMQQIGPSFRRRRPGFAPVTLKLIRAFPLALGDARILFFRRKKTALGGLSSKIKLSKNTEINGLIVTLIS
jgi:hypothetical protein